MMLRYLLLKKLLKDKFNIELCWFKFNEETLVKKEDIRFVTNTNELATGLISFNDPNGYKYANGYFCHNNKIILGYEEKFYREGTLQNIISYKYFDEYEKRTFEDKIIRTFNIDPLFLLKDYSNYIKKFIKSKKYFNMIYFEMGSHRSKFAKLIKNAKSPVYDPLVSSFEGFLNLIMNCEEVYTDNPDLFIVGLSLRKKVYYYEAPPEEILENPNLHNEKKNIEKIFGSSYPESFEFENGYRLYKDNLVKFFDNRIFTLDKKRRPSNEIKYIKDEGNFYKNFENLKKIALYNYYYYIPPVVFKNESEEKKIIDDIEVFQMFFGQGNPMSIEAAERAIRENIKNLEYLSKKWIFIECQEDESKAIFKDKFKDLDIIEYHFIKYRNDFLVKGMLFSYSLDHFVTQDKLIFFDSDVLFCNKEAIYNISETFNKSSFFYLSKFMYRSNERNFYLRDRYFSNSLFFANHGICFRKSLLKDMYGNYPFYGSITYPGEDVISLKLLGAYNTKNLFSNFLPNYLNKNNGIYHNESDDATVVDCENIICHLCHNEQSLFDDYEAHKILQNFFASDNFYDDFKNYDGHNLPEVKNDFYMKVAKEYTQYFKFIKEVFYDENKINYANTYDENTTLGIKLYKELFEKRYGKNSDLIIVVLLDNKNINYLRYQYRNDNIYFQNIGIEKKLEYIKKKLFESIDTPFTLKFLTDSNLISENEKIPLNAKKGYFFNILNIFNHKFKDKDNILVISPRMLPNILNMKVPKCFKDTINIFRYCNTHDFSENILYFNGDHKEIYDTYIDLLSNKYSEFNKFYNDFKDPIDFIHKISLFNKNIKLDYINKYFLIQNYNGVPVEFKEDLKNDREQKPNSLNDFHS